MLGVYSTARALGRLLGQERYHDPEKWSPEMVTLRAWSIIENTSNHPLFEDFVDFVLKGDKLELGLNIPGFFENLDKRYEEALTLIPDMLGYTRGLENQNQGTSIRDWRVYKYLNSKR